MTFPLIPFTHCHPDSLFIPKPENIKGQKNITCISLSLCLWWMLQHLTSIYLTQEKRLCALELRGCSLPISQLMTHCLGLPKSLCRRKMLIIFFYVSGLISNTYTHSQLTCIVLVFSCRTVICPWKPSRVSGNQRNIRNKSFLIRENLWQSPDTISNLPFWVSLVEQTRVEIVKLSLELTERPPPDTVLELRLRPPDDLWESLWCWRVDCRDK